MAYINTDIHNELFDFTHMMVENGWQYVNKNNDHIVLNKKHKELDCIDIKMNHSDNTVHFILPIKNSPYSFYNHFSLHDSNAVSFLKNYISHFTR